MVNPYEVVKMFKKEVANYMGSPYAVAVDSCTNAIFLCCHWCGVNEVTIPACTYVSVPCAIVHAGGKINFEHVDWDVSYQLKPYPIYDCAMLFKRGMYVSGTFQCISFSASKLVNIGKGGMILTDNEEAVKWFKCARYEGRHEVPHEEDHFDMVGWNMYMTPEQAARGLQLMSHVDEEIKPKKVTYQDLSKHDVFTKANR